jgi:hypothetical protein
MMFDRDNYWREKIERLIRECPGITQAQLAAKSRKLTTPERHSYLYQLRDAGRVRLQQVNARGGTIAYCFWPVESPRDATPADRMAAMLADAKRQLHKALAAVDAALTVAAEMAADATRVELAPVRTATAPEGQLQSAT